MADEGKKKISAVLLRSICSITLTFLCVIVFDFIFTVSGIWMSGMIKVRIIKGIILALLFAGLIVLMFFAGKNFFASPKTGIGTDFLSICVLPMLMLGGLFGISLTLTGMAAMIIQYPCMLAAEVFLHDISTEVLEKIIYIAVFLQNFFCCLAVFAGVYFKKKKNK